jgi:hypothetical protein
MLRKPVCFKGRKPRMFQALFLNEDKSQNVEVLEEEQIDFARVQEHLKKGGSVFITSKNSQKLKLSTPRKTKNPSQHRSRMRTITSFYLDRV